MKKQKLFRNNIKITAAALVCLLAVALCAVLLTSCKNKDDENQTVLKTDEAGFVLVSNAEELKAFFEESESEKARLTATVDMGKTMLTVSRERGSIVLDGAKNTLYGTADCIIRLENGTSLTLNSITVSGEKDVIGCMQDAHINGQDVTLEANMSAIKCDGRLTVGDNSSITAKSKCGYGIIANSMQVGKNTKITAVAEKNAVNIVKKRLELLENAELDATTNTDYSAVKCTGTLVLNDGSVFTVKNEGEYHGAQADFIEINGDVTIRADGGKRGAGIFLFQLEENYTVNGHCKKELRKENGHGNIEFNGE